MQAVAGLKGGAADAILIDGNKVPPALLTPTTEAIVKGDAKCLSIAAASILAKVCQLMYSHQLIRRFRDLYHITSPAISRLILRDIVNRDTKNRYRIGLQRN
jgi:ribonuclease HII